MVDLCLLLTISITSGGFTLKYEFSQLQVVIFAGTVFCLAKQTCNERKYCLLTLNCHLDEIFQISVCSLWHSPNVEPTLSLFLNFICCFIFLSVMVS